MFFFLIFYLSQFFPPYFTSYSVCFSFSKIVNFSPYSRSHSVHFSFSMSFSVSRHNSCTTVCVSHFPSLSVFLAIFQVLQSLFIFFHVFQGFTTYITSCPVCFSFSMIFSFFAILQILQCVFLIFHVFKCFSP